MNEPVNAPEKETILVVDDTPDNLSLMAGLLKDTYRVKLANSGEKALAAVRGPSPPDLILLDIMMPGMSGYEVCEQLKQRPCHKQHPDHFPDRHECGGGRKKGLDLGAADYLTKPVRPTHRDGTGAQPSGVQATA